MKKVPVMYSVLFFYLEIIKHQPNIQPDNPTYFDNRYPAGYWIRLQDIWSNAEY
jgi:hypothetical protein